MRNFIDWIYQTGILRISKMKWFEYFIKTQAKAINKKNIKEKWHEIDIYPMNLSKILDKLSKSTISW